MNIIKVNRKINGISALELAKELRMPILLYIVRERRNDFTVEQFRMLCGLLNILY